MTWIAKSGARLGDRYMLEAKVGEGGMGEVWRAKHLTLESEVAIKLLSGSLASSEETKKRFLAEAKLTAKIHTRHAVRVFDSDVTDDGQPYLVMELLHGEPLGDRIAREKKISLSATAHIMNAAAKALYRAHALGIIHRDFKPDNIFLTKGEDDGEEVKVVDFGIAKLIGSLDEARPSATDMAELTGRALSTLTRTGKLVGTPHYMSPEQVRMSNDEIGSATDIWAFGVVAFEALTGVCPFEGDSVITLFANIQLGKSLKASELNPDIPPAFDEWFKVACATEPSLRYPDAQTAATLLADALGVSIGTRVAMPADSSSRLQVTSSPDISLVSSTDALSRSPSKNTLLSSTTDGPIPMNRSRTALWGALASVLLVVGTAIGVVSYASAHAQPGPAQVTATHAAPPAATSAQATISQASAHPSALQPTPA
ncbi:MAG: serine/threonine-protein kinase, partial [Polyangiaceae bacterium]